MAKQPKLDRNFFESNGERKKKPERQKATRGKENSAGWESLLRKIILGM